MDKLVYFTLLLALAWMTVAGDASDKPPNIVFILTDDQDVVIGGSNHIPKARKYIGDAGITFDNMFVTSPLCCPSRSSIMTGKYVHNHNALNNSIDGNCSSPIWQETTETRAFATFLKHQKYNTFFAGKYLNQYGKTKAGGVAHVPPGWDDWNGLYGYAKTGGVEHIPPGWDDWNGLVGNSVYYNYKLSVNGTMEAHGEKYPEDYLTDLIGKRAVEFLQKQSEGGSPFFAMLSTPAAHMPFTPAPQYEDLFPNLMVPRNGSFGKHGDDKHWIIRQARTPMAPFSSRYVDEAYRNRTRTLQSVDDIVENVVKTLESKGMLDNTYVIYTSDNGFHLGQFSLPNDKRQLYEFDIRVPLMVRGPGIKPGQVRKEIILNIDFAPTFIDISGITPPTWMDGQSFLSVLHAPAPLKPESWRTDFMVEHWGEYTEKPGGCPKWNNQRMGNCYPDCVCEDSYNNTYTCVRTISSNENLMYCQFADDVAFEEYYDLHKDPDQLKNIATVVDPMLRVGHNHRMIELAACEGPSCRKMSPFPGKDAQDHNSINSYRDKSGDVPVVHMSQG